MYKGGKQVGHDKVAELEQDRNNESLETSNSQQGWKYGMGLVDS